MPDWVCSLLIAIAGLSTGAGAIGIWAWQQQRQHQDQRQLQSQLQEQRQAQQSGPQINQVNVGMTTQPDDPAGLDAERAGGDRD